MDLGEEFDLADAAAALLEVKAGTGDLGAVVVGANPPGQPADLRNRPEIKALAPDKWPDRGEEVLTRSHIASTGARADEGRPLPRQGRAFVMGQRGVDRDGQRADLARRTQPQVDAEDIALGIDVAHQLHQAARHALRRFARLVPLAPGSSAGS